MVENGGKQISLSSDCRKYENFDFFVFVSCLDLGFSCLYRYTRNTRFSCFLFPSLIQDRAIVVSTVNDHSSMHSGSATSVVTSQVVLGPGVIV